MGQYCGPILAIISIDVYNEHLKSKEQTGETPFNHVISADVA